MQLMFSLGAFIQSFPLMQTARFVFGIGGESLAVAQNTYAVSWFKGKELNMVFGFQVQGFPLNGAMLNGSSLLLVQNVPGQIELLYSKISCILVQLPISTLLVQLLDGTD